MSQEKMDLDEDIVEVVEDAKLINRLRGWNLLVAEAIDAWRVVPRLLVASYAYACWRVIEWYMQLAAPTTQQAALVTTVIGAAAVIIGVYTNTGRDWSKPIVPWFTKKKDATSSNIQS